MYGGLSIKKGTVVSASKIKKRGDVKKMAEEKMYIIRDNKTGEVTKIAQDNLEATLGAEAVKRIKWNEKKGYADGYVDYSDGGGGYHDKYLDDGQVY